MKYKLKHEIPHDSSCGKKLLSLRGIKDVELYLNIDESILNDFLLLDNIVTAAEKLKYHLDKNNNIFLIVDSDSDGYNSAAITYLYIKEIYPNAKIEYGIHKGKQHGLSDMTGYIEGNKYDLVIIPDAGSNDDEYYKEYPHIDFLVLDHHIRDTSEPIPSNVIIVNNQMSEKYPNKTLSGGGIVYKFCQCFDSLYNFNLSDNFIDLAAVALVGDMMDLRDYETHFLVQKGLNNIKNKGLKALIKKQEYSIGDINDISPDNIAWYITPLINAIIRVGTEEEKEILFLALIDGDREVPSTKRGAKAGETETAAEQTARVSTNARNRQNKIKETAIEKLETKIHKYNLLENKVLFIRLEEDDVFPSELNGLIAMQIAAKYKKPTIVARLGKDGFIKGSARGLNTSELKDFKTFLEDTGAFEYTAGHNNAFGISIPDDKLRHFHTLSNKELENIDFSENVYEVDFIFDGQEELATPILELGKLYKCWGQGISEPLVVVEKMIINKTEVQVMGANKNSCKIIKNGVSFIKFKDDNFIQQLMENEESQVTIIGKPKINIWCGQVNPQINIDDYEIINYAMIF